MKVAELAIDMTNDTSQCPSTLTQCIHSNKRTCAVNSNSASCAPAIYSIEYSKVCDKIKVVLQENISGLLLPPLMRFGSGPHYICPCTNINQARSASNPSTFVGNDYFCDTIWLLLRR